jgi:PKD repeat protein
MGRVVLPILVFFCILQVQSCEDSDTVVQSQNSPPAAPVLDPLNGAPRDGAVGQETTLVLSWTCSDADTDPLKYDVHLGTNATPPVVLNNHAWNCFAPASLDYATTYYWSVVAKDDHGHSTASDTWSFSTRSRTLSCNASGSPTSGPPPLTVSFTAGASGGKEPYSYGWVFKDGRTSTVQNPSHTFMAPGTYHVVLTVTDDELSTCSRAVAVTVAGPLTCGASADPVAGPPPLTVIFTGNAQGGQAPYSYHWSFGDGGSSTFRNPNHMFTKADIYSVVFTVTDARSDICSETIVIEVGQPLTCSASGTPTSGSVPLTVSFMGSADGGQAPYRFNWIFGDGGGSVVPNPMHTYTAPGTYNAILWVTDAQSKTCSKTVPVVCLSGTR